MTLFWSRWCSSLSPVRRKPVGKRLARAVSRHCSAACTLTKIWSCLRWQPMARTRPSWWSPPPTCNAPKSLMTRIREQLGKVLALEGTVELSAHAVPLPDRGATLSLQDQVQEVACTVGEMVRTVLEDKQDFPEP